MLIAATSLSAGQDQLSVVYDHNPAALIATFAELVIARDPYGTLPPSPVDLKGLSQMLVDRSTLSLLAQGIVERAMASAKTFASDTEKMADLAQFKPVMTMAHWLTMGSTVTMPRGFLFRVTQTKPTSMVQAASASLPLASLRNLAGLNDSAPGAWPQGKAIDDLAFVTLWSRFQDIVAAPHYSGAVEPIPMGAQKESYAYAVRVRRLITLVAILRQSIQLAELREVAAWLSSPAVTPMLEYISPQLKEELDSHIKQILALKVHPWIAETERMRLEARRYTEWSDSSQTMGLAREGLFKSMLAYARVRGTQAKTVDDLRAGFIIGIQSSDADKTPTLEAISEGKGMLLPFIYQAREVLMLRQVMEQSDIAQAEAVLGLTQPTSPPQLNLHGKTWKLLAMTGDMASEATPDLLNLLVKPRMALALPGDVSNLAGNVTAFGFSARSWVEGTNSVALMQSLLVPAEKEVPLFVDPSDPMFSNGYTLYQLTPEMIKPETTEEYFGDEDAQFDTYSMEGLARMLGMTSVEEMVRLPGFDARISHLFKSSGAGWDRMQPSATRIFYSARTRKTWRVRVDLPRDAMPTRVIAFDARTAPLAKDIESVIIRTPDRPSLAISTEELAQSAAMTAAKGIGADE